MPKITSKQIEWILDKALPDIVLSKQSISLDTNTLIDTFTITRQGDGVINVSSSNTSIATVSLSETTATVTAIATGSCTITVNVASSVDGNYLNDSKTLSVECTLTKTLNYTPAQIQSIVSEGKAAVTFGIGDMVDITLVSGTVGSVTLSGTYKFAILGMDHNNAKELPSGKSHSIHLGLSKNLSDTEIAFTDWADASMSGSRSSSNSYFVHKGSSTDGSNAGGWEKSNMRTNICANFLNRLPSTWRSVITAIPKYTDNTGGGSYYTEAEAEAVTTTTDKIWLLAEFEIWGKRSYANKAEQNSQEQYDYYKNGNSVIRYGHQQTGTAVAWWERSANARSSMHFCGVGNSGSVLGYELSSYRHGFVPCFAICG